MRIKSLLTSAPDQELVLSFHRYDNGRLAIRASTPNGEPVATLTSNVPNIDLAPTEILVKEWSEGKGALATLQAAGLVTPLREVRVGWALGHVCEWKGPQP